MLKYNKHQPAHWVAGEFDPYTEQWVKTPLIVESDIVSVLENPLDGEDWLEAHGMLIAVNVVDEAIARSRLRSR